MNRREMSAPFVTRVIERSAERENKDAEEILNRLVGEFNAERDSRRVGERVVNRIIEKTGDLFAERDVSYLAHCISRDCRMGAGIAKEFVRRYGAASFRQRVALGAPVVGGVVPVTTESGTVVYNLVTKQRSYQKPTLSTLQSALVAMRTHAEINGVKRISMPRIGCGLDGLMWRDVRALIERTFDGSDIEIVVVDINPPIALPRDVSLVGDHTERSRKRARSDDVLDALTLLTKQREEKYTSATTTTTTRDGVLASPAMRK